MQKPLDRLLSLDLSGGPLLILTHDNPDPDSLASAAALKYLLATRGVESQVAYTGIIGRAENRTMLEVLDLDVIHVAEIDPERFRYLALVDAQPLTGNSEMPGGRLPDIVIDHHPLREATKSVRFYDVRVGIGASATILGEYLRDAGVAIPADLATALLYGIRSETQDLTREASDEDRETYRALLAQSDAAKLARISRPRLSREYYTQLADAIDSLLVGTSEAVCMLGEVIHPDFVPEVADFFARMTGVEYVLVGGYVGDRLYVSIRTNDVDANAGAFMQQVLSGIGAGGGHGMRAGGNVRLTRETDREDLEIELIARFLRARGADVTELAPLRSSDRASSANSDTISSASRS